MAEGYLKRNDVSDTQRRPNPRGIYAAKHLENDDPELLQTAVNLYLLALPNATGAWSPHVVSTQFMAVPSVSGPPSIAHHCWITIFASGTVTTAPIG